MRVPDDIKYDLHILLVEHGKRYKNDCKVLRQQMLAQRPRAELQAASDAEHSVMIIKAEIADHEERPH